MWLGITEHLIDVKLCWTFITFLREDSYRSVAHIVTFIIHEAVQIYLNEIDAPHI